LAKVESHRDLIVWQKAMDLAVEVYSLTRKFSLSETYRLVLQFTRAAASVPADIAEGNARGTRRDCASFLAVAKGSLMEC
jgi:four helix bundle protein